MLAMSPSPLGLDAYQLTTLIAHADAGRLQHRVSMAVFFRKMPSSRNYVIACGLERALDYASRLVFDDHSLAALERHPLLGPALGSRPQILQSLRDLKGFEGELDAVREGTLVFAGPASRTDGSPFLIDGTRLHIYLPLVQVRTDMVRAKLLETPWLGFVNHMSMVASKAARVVSAASGKPVLEFGSRRTHPWAALDAAYAAYIAGTSATSNLAAFEHLGIPATGTMDHFAVQASERSGVPREQTEREFFASFARAFPSAATLLVDTYDTDAGIAAAVEATGGALTGIRIDSNVTVATVQRARALLTRLGAPAAKIVVSDALDEWRVRELAPYADGFGVGENITCSPDASAGIGAVAKLTVNGYGAITMKLAKGSGKATLPGELRTYRFADHDLVATASEPSPAGGTPLLVPVWRGNTRVKAPQPVEETRDYVRGQIASLAPELQALEVSSTPRALVASDALVALIRSRVDLS
jgi:nicotinate phosphoribosyltransferase